ncbi:MAG: alpha/beta hydrolase [Candidatus Nanopelagicales bacterium]|nr:alpha/beta hydrolase [Candidatus Nanopelagicales bacterium]
MRPSRLIPGLAMLAAVVAAIAKSRSAITEGHPSYLILLVVVAVMGLGLCLWSFGSRPKPGGVRAVFRWAGAAAGIGLAAVTFWLAPYLATPVPTAAPAVSISSTNTGILMLPTQARRTGVAFIPGALVDPRAYEQIFTPVVQAGYPVYIAKPAFGLAFSVSDVVAEAEAAYPLAESWVVAGHSLGGAVASRQTDQAAGLILLGAYPIDDISSADVPVLSVSGSNDLLSTPEDIEASRENLPDDTEFVVIEGGVHAFFGDYGPQAGDGQPTTTREQAQEQTQQAMIDFLNALPES